MSQITTHRPKTLAEFSEVLATCAELTVGGSVAWRYPTASREVLWHAFLKKWVEKEPQVEGSAPHWTPQREQLGNDAPSVEQLVRRDYVGIIELSVADQVVTVRAGSDIWRLQEELYSHGVSLPLAAPIPQPASYADPGAHDPVYEKAASRAVWFSPVFEDIGDAISMNLPHGLESLHGSWRDWVLGMKVVLADGTIVETGSKAVKNVAGYDVHKLVIGSRETLGVIAEVTLRVLPLTARRELPLRFHQRYHEELLPGKFLLQEWIQRVPREKVETAVRQAEADLIAYDPENGTLWASVSEDRELPRYAGDWLLRSHCGEKNVQITDPTQVRFMKQAKAIFDPEGKLNPGEFGFL